MSFVQGLNIATTAIAPESNDLKFDATVNATLQQKYDDGYNRASILYGSILNPDVTREDSIKAKEEFQRMITNDLKQAGKIDWSISKNVENAAKSFQSLWSNKLLLADARWTKEFQNELSRAESLRVNPNQKSGERYWDEGLKYMMYKREEFKNSNPSDALNFESVKFIPYSSVMDKAIAKLNESGLKAEYDKIEGGYKITTQNGEILKSPLTALFNQTLGEDPRLVEMFKVKAYVDRKDWVSSKLSVGEYNNESEASLNYMNAMTQKTLQSVDRMYSELNVDRTFVNQKYEALKQGFINGEFEEGSDLHNHLIQLENLKTSSDTAEAYLQQLQQLSASGNQQALNVMVDAFDNQNAFNYFDQEIKNAVDVLAFKDYKFKMEADPFALKEFDHKLELKEMAVRHSYDVQMENLEASNAMNLAKYKATNGDGSENGGSTNDAVKTKAFNDAKNEADSFNTKSALMDEYRTLYKAAKGTEYAGSDAELAKEKNSELYKQAQRAVFVKKQSLYNNANTAAARLGHDIPYPEALTAANFMSSEFQQAAGASDPLSFAYSVLKNETGKSLQDDQARKFAQFLHDNPTIPISVFIAKHLK